jgi:hypothetical protein
MSAQRRLRHGLIVMVGALMALSGVASPVSAGQVAPAAGSASALAGLLDATAVLVVDRLDDEPSATACSDAPSDCSLRGALINANADGIAEIETISVPAGTYVLTVPGNDAVSGSLNVTASVVLDGAGAATTIIDANGLDRALVVNGEGPPETRRLIASGLTFRGGRPCTQPGGDDGNNAGGGGLFIHGLAELTDVIVEDNTTCGAGGGIFADSYGSALTLTRSIVRDNTASGGAGGIESDFSLTMTDSTVSANLADQSPGGGLRLAGVATIVGSTISANVATIRGGGITTGDDTTSACCAATVDITNSTISGNVTHWWNSGTPQYFPGLGGGIHIGRSRFTLRQSTVTANVAETNPYYGAIGRAGGISTGYQNFLTLENSIVAGNVGAEECRFDPSTTYQATGSFGCSTGGIQDPQLGPLADNGGPTKTHGLAAGTPGSDAGDAGLCTTTDQRGEPRPSGAGCDIGAFELQVAPPPPPPASAADAVVVVSAGYSVPLGQLTDPLSAFGYDLVRGATSLATFDGRDLLGQAGPTDYVVGVDVLDLIHGDSLRLAEDVPAGWLPVFGGDCAADGSLRLHSGQLLTCTVTNTRLDEFQPAPTAAAVIASSFRTAPAIDLRSFDISLELSGQAIFAFDAQDMGQAGRRTLGFAVPAGDLTGIGVVVHGPAGWLAILGADCADAGHLYLELGKVATCTIEWFEVGVPEDPIVDLVIDDCTAASLAAVTVLTGNLVVTDPDCGSLALPNLVSITGNLLVQDSATLTELSMPVLERVDGDVVITGNAGLLDINLGALSFVGGNLTVTQNTAVDALATTATTIGGDLDVSQNATLTVISMPDVATVGGDMAMTNNPTLTTIAMPEAESVGGDFDVSGNATLTDLSAPTLTIIGGDMNVSSNATVTEISAPALTSVGGDMDISGNATVTVIEMPSVTTVTGDMDISGNATITGGGVLVLHLPALISVGGSIDISDNIELVTVDLTSMIDVGGDMTMSSNPTLTVIEMPEAETVEGDMVVTDNPTLTIIDAPSLETVGGDMTLELQAAAVDLATVSVVGDATIIGTGTDMLLAETALGTTSFQLLSGFASLGTTLPAGAFDTNVPYSVERLAGADLEAQGDVDPLAAYTFDFSVPTLGVDALVTFTIDGDVLDPADRQSLLDALAAGRATLAVRADGGTTFETLTVCAVGQTPAADDCVAVVIDDSIVTFSGVAGHFSTWAVVVVAAPDTAAPVVTVPDDKLVEAAGPSGSVVDFVGEVGALDAHDGVVATACLPASSATFPLGTTTVTCRAVDAAGNEGSAAFHVTIVDTTGPVVTVPPAVTVPATGATGAIVTFVASATDLVSGSRPVTCAPASGSLFGVGSTTVTCRALDAAGNVGIGTVVVRVLGPVDLLASLRGDVAGATPPLAPKLAADLAGKLDDAMTKLGQRKTADACKKVLEFMTKVDVEQSRHAIPAALAEDWRSRARQIRTLLGC